ncbi:hypothetical protein COHA_005584 [Chlorella ohadii]|uniref:Uncharacterized protein n=1 Tax=Chlorella ohadii TaxID=2649997 RepID=A0AAD5H5B2_9CHLO|nr:hypothetical protein COHA_005584 [Chlorella ohadii]
MVLRGGGLFGDQLLSQDGSLLFVCNVDAVVAFATSTGEQVARLQHAARVTAVCLHPRDSLLLYSGSSDGRITLWDLSTGAHVRLWHVGSPIESLAVSPSGDTAYISSHWRLRQAGRLFAFDLGSGAAKSSSGRAKVSQARRLVASASGQILATVDRHTALVWAADTFPKHPLALTHTKPLTCAALSSTGDALAVGDATGRILLWRGVHAGLLACAAPGNEVGDMDAPAAEQLRARATVHWHAEPVCSMAFSPDDAYLLSGGHEGTCLRHISPCAADPSCVAVSLSDNLVRMRTGSPDLSLHGSAASHPAAGPAGWGAKFAVF